MKKLSDDEDLSEIDDAESDEDEDENISIPYMDSTDTESFPEESSDESFQETGNSSGNVITDISINEYYCVYYDEGWYIGKVTGIEENKYQLKFMNQKDNCFIWPKQDDIDVIEKRFIFYGPVQLIEKSGRRGAEKWFLNDLQKMEIINKYKIFKRN